MAVDTGANVLPVFDLKSASLTLVALVLRTTDVAVLSQELEHRFGDAPALFDNDPLVIDLTPVAGAADDIDFEALAAVLRAHRLLPQAREIRLGSGTNKGSSSGFAAGGSSFQVNSAL